MELVITSLVSSVSHHQRFVSLSEEVEWNLTLFFNYPS